MTSKKRKWLLIPMLSLCLNLAIPTQITAHCQMPCGIYHDEMVFDFIDQYVETMYKAISILTEFKTSTPKELNTFVRWVIEKEQASDDVAELITKYFLQQKIKPGEPDTDKCLRSAHQMLFYMVQIKQNTDLGVLEKFADEWERFKLLFHVEGYECKIEMLKMKKIQDKQLESKQKEQDVAPPSAGQIAPKGATAPTKQPPAQIAPKANTAVSSWKSVHSHDGLPPHSHDD